MNSVPSPEDSARLEVLAANKEWWERMVAEGNGFTRPWLDLDPLLVQKYAGGTLANPPKPLAQIFPVSVLAGVRGKDVLCLASGGGQQSAVFGILGANVTVVDIADGQLAGDRKAADYYGYTVTTIQGNMSDLSALADSAFDVVFQAPSMGYVPDVKQVYSEVSRVIRPGGSYRADAENPLAQFVDESSWDGEGYRVSMPYAVKENRRAPDKNVYEYRHYLSEAINGLIERGFMIEKVQESPADLYQDQEPEPGTWLHSELYVPGSFAILATKR